MRKSRILKASRLVELGACAKQVRRFRRLWGAQVRVTVPRMVAVADKFDWNWGAEGLLSAPAEAEYQRVCAPARAEYLRVRAQAEAEYQRVSAQAEAEYQRVSAPALAEYERVRAAAWAEYQRVCAAAWAEYQRVCAAAWASAYINDQEG